MSIYFAKKKYVSKDEIIKSKYISDISFLHIPISSSTLFPLFVRQDNSRDIAFLPGRPGPSAGEAPRPPRPHHLAPATALCMSHRLLVLSLDLGQALLPSPVPVTHPCTLWIFDLPHPDMLVFKPLLLND